jgi:cytochrome c-type biogenesis protein CcmH
MIGFWIAAAILTAGVVGLLTLPLMRRAAPAVSTEEADLAVYRDQLAELERDRARGLVEPDQAAALEAEIGRRMLGVARAPGAAPLRTAPARRLTYILCALVPVGALSIYLAVGHPDLPGQPLAERAIAPDSDPAKILATVDQLKSKLKPVKEDLGRWVALAQVYNRLGRPRDASDAFRVAFSLAPEDPELGAALAETLVQANGGAVGEEAKRLFTAVPADSPVRPEAQYYLALADAQSGDMKAALARWQDLLRGSPADADYLAEVRARIASAAQSLGLDPAKETPEPRPAATPEASGPNASDIEAAAQMSPEQRMAMIRSMVAGLAAKLEANPDDAAGWRRLARAYQVLGEADKAKEALGRAEAAERKTTP